MLFKKKKEDNQENTGVETYFDIFTPLKIKNIIISSRIPIVWIFIDLLNNYS